MADILGVGKLTVALVVLMCAGGLAAGAWASAEMKVTSSEVLVVVGDRACQA
ncbi:MAG: hypothetical protein JSV65_09310 [Armatimonadota bacterium]|nr:MAG: hypothetical protein JSV65_09310 [Armatimonadota bacterium]